MILVRRHLGDVLRQRRLREGRTLRQVASAARVSPGYLSEIERGQKEPSSELLGAICDALDVRLSDLILELSAELAAAELAAAELGLGVPASAGAMHPTPSRAGTQQPVTVSGAKPGGHASTRPAPRPVTRRMPVPPVPVASSGGATVPAASNLATSLPTGISLPPMGPGGVPLLEIGDVFVAA
jgi:transcriptional regulator with XRE-family HTH domain